MSASSSGDGSSSTTIAMFCIVRRNRRGIEASASATSCSNFFRSTRWGRLLFLLRLFRRLAVARPGDDEPDVIAVLAHGALVAQRLRAADAAAVENQRVGGARPPRLRHRRAELRLDDDGIVALGDSDPVGHAE